MIKCIICMYVYLHEFYMLEYIPQSNCQYHFEIIYSVSILYLLIRVTHFNTITNCSAKLLTDKII